MVLQTVTVPRDYSQGILTRFDETFPNDLAGRVSPDEFKHTIESINAFFLEAETVDFSTFMEGCLGCLSLFSLYFCYDDKYKKVLKRFNAFLRAENDRVYKPRGIEWINPLTNGLLHIELIVQQQV